MKIFKKKEKELYWNPKDIDEKGFCHKALDKRGNPKKPDEGDMLVKAQ